MIHRLLLALLAALCLASAAAAQHATEPVAPETGKRWRIGYVESGDYVEYPLTLGAIADGLERLGWLRYAEPRPDDLSGPALWQWLARHADSQWLEFVADAYWRPGNFDAAQRAPMRTAIAARIDGQADLDLMITMGTWAGQDMRALGPPLPVVAGAVSDAIAAGIADSVQDSGHDNLHVGVEPQRYQRQLRLFHEVVAFDSLGLVYEDSVEGRGYAAVAAAGQVAAELGFRLEHCHAPWADIEPDQAVDNAVNCYAELAARHVEAIYVTSHRGVTSESIERIAELLNQARIPSFAMAGSSQVQQGLLMSLAQADVSYIGLFHAQAIARILNGALPRELSQRWPTQPDIALNISSARRIGFDPPVEILLAADDFYE